MADRHAAIGVFDSGLGGLTVLAELLKVLPQEKYIYFADQFHAPYGRHKKSEIRSYVSSISDFLLQKNVKMLVAACNTASVTALDILEQKCVNISTVNVVDYSIRSCLKQTLNLGLYRACNIKVLATPATCQSKVFTIKLRELYMLNKLLPPAIEEIPCPEFVEITEQGHFSDTRAYEVVAEKLQHFNFNDTDIVILGCTHFQLLLKPIARYLNNVILVDPARALAFAVKDILDKHKLLVDATEAVMPRASVGNNKFFTTGDAANFCNLAGRIVPLDFTSVEHVDFRDLLLC